MEEVPLQTDIGSQRKSAQMIRLTNGKECLLYEGHTFFFRYAMKDKTHKYCCTKFPKCKSFVVLDGNYMVLERSNYHNHDVMDLYRCADGRYVKFKNMKATDIKTCQFLK